MKRGLFLLALVLAMVTFARPAAAQVTGTGTIEVVVLDASKGALPGATVTATAPDTPTKRTAVTDAAGKALIQALQPSEKYVVTAALQGFKTVRFDNVLVRSGQTVVLSLTLEIGGMSEEVKVTATTPLVDPTSAQRGAGHHAAADRVAADGPLLPELPAARARASAGRSEAAGQPGVASPASTTATSAATSACRPTTSTTSTAST